MTGPGGDPKLQGLLGPFVALARVILAAGGLLRSEAGLAAAEARAAAQDLLRGLVLVLVGAVLAMVALNMLAEAGVEALKLAGLSPLWARLAAGAALLLIVFALISAAKAKFSATGRMGSHLQARVASNMAVLREAQEHHDV